MDKEKQKSILESLLFVSGEPLKISKIAKILNLSLPETENLILELEGDYAARKSGLAIVKKEKEVQLGSNPENSQFVNEIVKSELQEELSPAALEVLSIIAYRGPVTRSEVELIRGVNCSYTLRNLLLRGLVERLDNPKDNRGYIYQISFEFLKKLGMGNASQLPDYETLSKDERIGSIINTPQAE